MPILSVVPVLDRPELLPDPFLDSRTFSFRSLDGETLLPFSGDEFIARWGIQGLDVPKRTIIEEATPGQDGTNVVDVQIGSRTYTLPLFVGSNSSHYGYLQNRGYLRRFFNHRGIDYKTLGGTFDLVANSAMGERFLRSMYVDGMDGQWERDTTGSYWESVGIQCLASRPYWQGERWSTPEVRPPAPLPWPGPWPPVLQSSRSLSTPITVTVGGDAESWPLVLGVGPADDVTIEGPGIYVSIPDGLASGEHFVIDLAPESRRALFDGVSAWGRVAPSTIWAPLDPGDQMMTVSVTGWGSTTVAQVQGPSNYETPW